MKTLKNFAVVVCVSVLTFYGCKDETKAAVTATPTTTETAQETTPTDTNTDTDTKVIAENTGTVYHYTCSRGCAGGSATAGTCSTCGNTLAHNQAFHSNNTNQDNSNVAPLFGDPAKNANTNTSSTTNASQNAAGVFHYTCGNGCAGGAGAAGNCSNCGATLAHNQAYHN